MKVLITLVIVFLVGIALFVTLSVLGFLGVYFKIWPTWISDHKLEITDSNISKLGEMISESKFRADESIFYPGLRDEPTRMIAQSIVDLCLKDLLAGLPKNPKRSFVLRNLKVMLSKFENFDSEERDRVAIYSEQILNILDIKGSGELINVWRYGFPYGWVSKK